jgi:hypothetical protein
MKLKDFNNVEQLDKPIYLKKPYVILNNNMVLASGDYKHIMSLKSWNYYNDCNIDIRRNDLHLNDNTKI